MSVATMSHFFATLSLITWAATIATLVLALVRRFRPDSGAAAFVEDLGGMALWLGWLVAAVTMAGSLYYSIGPPQFTPCELCWYQRICLYPMAAILLIAAIKKFRGIWLYVLPQLVIGAAIAIYHTQLQAFPKQQSFCQAFNPCTTRYVWEFHIGDHIGVSLPFMSLAASTFMITMVLVSRATDPDRYELDAAEGEDDVDLTAGSDPAPGAVGAPPDQVGAR
jgi:disulfide bond formation protein DsbB